mmetsp:Transcript_11994/g.19521  ORF Transcript_11994/g.19521 Transcript_11994/m.19521 type:complete len:232 (-) Transcript_11994:877-1572(-)
MMQGSSVAFAASAFVALVYTRWRRKQSSQKPNVAAGNRNENDCVVTESRCALAIQWLRDKNAKVVVFDMDHTMSALHCGNGQPKETLHEYVDAVSPDFVTFAKALVKCKEFKLAVATGSDPAEYGLPGISKGTHLCGGDLAVKIIEKHCPECLEAFEIMVGYDNKLHGGLPENEGKRYHMREIANHYGVSPEGLVLFDDHWKNLNNEAGWLGVLVEEPRIGFRFEDIFKHM